MITPTLLWLTFTFKDIVDVLLVGLFLYYLFLILRSSGSKALFYGVFVFMLIWVLFSQILGMRLMGSILDKIVSVGFIVLAIIFQDEIKKFLATIGSSRRWRVLRRVLIPTKRDAQVEEKKFIAPLALACLNLARDKMGALIAVQGNMDLTAYTLTGESFRADLNSRLVENVFFKNSPLHDGAMIVIDGEIRAAGCILPVSSNQDLDKDLGLRHRSALGLAQETDALVIIVSEERGKISVAHEGEIYVDVSVDELREMLEHL